MPILKTATGPRVFLRMFIGVLLVGGMAGLVLTAVFGFEEPNDRLLLLTSGLLLAAIAAVLVHLTVTRELTRSQKRAWLARLTGRSAPWTWGEYLTCDDLGAAATKFAEEEASLHAEGKKATKPRDYS